MRAAFSRFPMAEARLSTAIAAYANAPPLPFAMPIVVHHCESASKCDPTRDTGKALS
jgi:hypothetical protein